MTRKRPKPNRWRRVCPCQLRVRKRNEKYSVFPPAYKKPAGNSADRSLSSEAPRVGLEPTTPRLTAVCSTIELSRIIWHKFFPYTFKTIYCQSIFKTFFYPMTLCENIGCIRSETGHSESASLLPRAFCFANVCPLRLFPSGVQALLLPQPCVQPLSSLFGQALDLLVTVSSTRYRASTSALSTLSSSRGLTSFEWDISS